MSSFDRFSHVHVSSIVKVMALFKTYIAHIALHWGIESY